MSIVTGSVPRTVAQKLSETASVLDFGAKGDGITNDRVAVQLGVDALVALGGGTLVFPSGWYLIAGWSPDSTDPLQPYQIHINNTGAPVTLNLVGEDAEIVSGELNEPAPTQTYGRIIHWEGGFADCRIENLAFRHTHGLTGADTSAVYLDGGSGYTMQRFYVSGCVFRNFNSAFCPMGVDAITIDANFWRYDLGRDSGTLTAIPAVGISSGRSGIPTRNATITNNDFSGAEGNVSANSHGAIDNRAGMDGLIFGIYRGLVATGNNIRNIGVEGIQISARSMDVVAGSIPLGKRFPCIISDNLIDCNPAPGSARNWSYGIRCDESDLLVDGNNITSAVRGILCFGPEIFAQVGLTPERQVFRGNKITMLAVGSLLGIDVEIANRIECRDNSIVWPDGQTGDGRTVTDAAMTAGAAGLTSATASFTAADAYKTITVAGAGTGGADLIGRIAGVTNATTIFLYENAATSVTGAAATFYTASVGVSMLGVVDARVAGTTIRNAAPASGQHAEGIFLQGVTGNNRIEQNHIVGCDVAYHLRGAIVAEIADDSLSGIKTKLLLNSYADTTGLLMREQ